MTIPQPIDILDHRLPMVRKENADGKGHSMKCQHMIFLPRFVITLIIV